MFRWNDWYEKFKVSVEMLATQNYTKQQNQDAQTLI